MKKNPLAPVLGAVLCATLAAPLPALAQGSARKLSYNYADGRIVLWEPDGGGDLDGVRLGGSVRINPDLFAVGSLTQVGRGGFDLTLLDFGLGFRRALSPRTDLVAIGGLVLAEVDAGAADNDDSGISLTGGVRSMVGPQLELGGYLNYADYFGDGDLLLTGEGLLHVTPQLSLAGSLGFSDDYNVLTLGARWNFR